MTKRIQIDDEIEQFLLSHAVDIGESPSDILRRVLGIAPPHDTIEVDDDVYRFIVSKAQSLQETASDVLHRELAIAPTPPGPGTPPPPPPPPPGPTIVEFHIPAGTGSNPWNTLAAPVEAHVGDTLRIVNDDSVAHLVHASGRPFPHQSVAGPGITPGQFVDFPILTTYDPLIDLPVTDHLHGGRFFIRVT